MKKESFEKITMVLIAISLIVGGGYFVSASAFLSIVLIVLLAVQICREGHIALPIGKFLINALSCWWKNFRRKHLMMYGFEFYWY